MATVAAPRPIPAVQLLLEDDSDVPLPLNAPTREAWLVQCGRAEGAGSLERLKRRLARCFALSLVECLDADLKPPTDARLSYATDIARQLGLNLPAEAIRFAARQWRLSVVMRPPCATFPVRCPRRATTARTLGPGPDQGAAQARSSSVTSWRAW